MMSLISPWSRISPSAMLRWRLAARGLAAGSYAAGSLGSAASSAASGSVSFAAECWKYVRAACSIP
jgi:hypothetical protein